MDPRLHEFVGPGAVASFHGPATALLPGPGGGFESAFRALEGAVGQAAAAGIAVGVALPFLSTLLRKVADVMDVPVPGQGTPGGPRLF